jgi:hypothetical protein
MNPRTTFFLVAVAGGLFAFIFFFEHQPRPVAGLATSGPVLPTLRPSAVNAVLAQAAGQPAISVERKADGWHILQPISTPAQGAVVENLLQVLSQVTWHTHLTEADLQGHADADREFGFSPPLYTFTFQQDGQRLKLLLGSRTPLGDEVFVRVDDRKEIYTVDIAMLKYVPPTLNDWRDPSLVRLNGLAFNRLIVTNGAKVFELQRDATNSLWHITRPVEARADSARVNDLLARLQGLRVTRFITDDPKPDLDSFGMQPPALTLALDQDTNEVFSLQFGKNPTNSDTQIFVRRSDQNGVALIGAEALTPWSGTYEDFRDRHLLNLAAQPPREIEVHGLDNFTLQLQSNDVWSILPPYNFPLDAGLTRQFLGGVAALQATQFVKTVVTEPDLPNYGLAPAARTLILKPVDTNLPPVHLDFSAPQDGKVFARRTDETCVYALPATDLATLPDFGWMLREQHLWDFNETNVTALTLSQDGRNRALTHGGTNEWVFAPGSQGIINNFAVEETVDRLGGLTVAAWVARNETNLAQYGFTPGSLQLTLTTKTADKTGTCTLQIGGVSPTQLYYATTPLDGDNWVFELPPQLGELIHAYLVLPPAP